MKKEELKFIVVYNCFIENSIVDYSCAIFQGEKYVDTIYINNSMYSKMTDICLNRVLSYLNCTKDNFHTINPLYHNLGYKIQGL